MEIAEATESDMEDVLLVERVAFGGDEEAELVYHLLSDPSARPALSLLARDEERRPLGHVLFTAARLDNASLEVSVSILAPLAVVPEAQRQGVGGRLIRAGLQRLARAGVELVFVRGHPDYYPRFGFEPAIPLGLEASYPISPEEAWMVQALEPGLLGSVSGTVACADAMNKPEYWRE